MEVIGMLHKADVVKISIIGAGFVGSTTAYALIMSGIASEIVIVDLNKEKAEGEAMDLSHGLAFVKPVQIKAGDYEDIIDSDIVILTAGANQKPGETRIDLINRNVQVFKSIVPQVVQYAPKAILLVVTNPVDILTYVTYKLSGFPKERVIGSGTVLDTARLRYLLSNRCGVDVRNVHTYMIGEHGDTEVPAWSITTIAGANLNQFCLHCCGDGGCKEECQQELHQKTVGAAYEIIEKKGATYYAVALGVKRIVEAIIRNENSILSVSSLLEGQFGVRDVCLSLPTIVNGQGAERILNVPLDDKDIQGFVKSAKTIKKFIDQIQW